MRRPVDRDEFEEIRELWKGHSIAEDNRDLPGLISTLTDDCVYEVMGTAHAGKVTRARSGSTPSSSPHSPTSTSTSSTPWPDRRGSAGGARDGDARGALARARADGEARLAERELLRLGSAAEKFKGETVYTDLVIGREA